MTSFDRSHPFSARLVERRLLTSPQSARPTLHVVFSLQGSGLTYQPGDVVGLIPHNEPALVDLALRQLGLSGDESVTLSSYWSQEPGAAAAPFSITSSLRDALSRRLALGSPPLRLIRAAIDRIESDDEAGELEDQCEDDAAMETYLAQNDIVDFLSQHPTARFSAHELTGLLGSLQPRTYSIASSPLRHPQQIHLTVGLVSWSHAGRDRNGVTSAHLRRMAIGDSLPLYVQPTRHFTMPEDHAARMILIGPGTGVAPFLGYLDHRAATGGAPSWLFFGSQTEAHDHYYRDELAAHLRSGTLARLDLAFSRDQAERIYVQKRMRESADELWSWLEGGAHLYLCGDAQKMAPDVERTLMQIADARGKDGAQYLASLKEQKRYRRDVY
jgi:sulfite reductase (NADPH) flavoprotein alpha-component